MAKGQIHLTPDGPAPCSADPSKPGARGCPYGAGGHYATEAEAEAAYGELMERQGLDALGSSAGSLSNLRAELQTLAAGQTPDLKELQRIGGLIEDELLSRAGVEVDRKDLTSAELERLGAAASAVLKELQGEPVALRSKFHGPFAKQLKEALAPVPSGAAYLVYGDVHTETVNARNSSRDGFHIQQAAIMAPAAIGTKSSMRISPMAKRGDLVVDSSIARRAEIERGELQGFAVDRIERGVGERLQDGDSVLHAIRQSRADDRFIELLQEKVLDTDGVILPGQAERFRELAPELVEPAEGVAAVSSFYAGKKPSSSKERRYRRVAKDFELKDSRGESYGVPMDLYEVQEKQLSFRDHTIGTKRYGGYSTAQNPVLLHEFSHAIQSARPGGIPRERELFQELSASQPQLKDDGYSRYAGFPDEYMGDVGGKEVFTRATEGIFYPGLSGNEYLYDGSTRSQDVRRWALGTWALLAAEGRKLKG